MTGLSGEQLRGTFWRLAGQGLRALRTKRGWSADELARRARVTADLVSTYEQARLRYPELEAWWRMTTALGVDLLLFLQAIEQRVGTSLLHDVEPYEPPPVEAATSGVQELRGFLKATAELDPKHDTLDAEEPGGTATRGTITGS